MTLLQDRLRSAVTTMPRSDGPLLAERVQRSDGVRPHVPYCASEDQD